MPRKSSWLDEDGDWAPTPDQEAAQEESWSDEARPERTSVPEKRKHSTPHPTPVKRWAKQRAKRRKRKKKEVFEDTSWTGGPFHESQTINYAKACDKLLEQRMMYKEQAREKGTLAWMLTYARHYLDANEIPNWEPTKRDMVPPLEYQSVDHIENYICHLWEMNFSKPTVTQGHKYLNFFLTKSGKPPCNKYHQNEQVE